VSNSCYIGNIYGASIDPATATGAYVDSSGKLGTTVSARRFKRDIQAMDRASEAILSLKPVTFHYKSDVKGTPCFGLIAEDVEKVIPDLVVHDKNGEVLTVRYDQVNAMLLNEFLKEHKSVDALKNDFHSTVARQQKEIQALTAQLKEQAAQIQRVNAQVELRTPAAKKIAGNQR
jgi:predicted ribosome quality control (RQC) complex YloA/Tae2 family protein